MKNLIMMLLTGVLAVSLAACDSTGTSAEGTPAEREKAVSDIVYTTETSISDVINDPVFGDYFKRVKHLVKFLSDIAQGILYLRRNFGINMTGYRL